MAAGCPLPGTQAHGPEVPSAPGGRSASADGRDGRRLLALPVDGSRGRHDGLGDGRSTTCTRRASKTWMAPSVVTHTASVTVPVSSDQVLMKSMMLTG